MKNVRVRLLLALTMLGAAAMTAPHVRVMLAHPASPNDAEKPTGWERARVNQTCEGCHVEIAAEWRESRHRQAFTNGPFQRSLARESAPMRPFCQGCHAPEANPLVPPSNLVADMGVGCVTCHAPQGPVLAAPGTGNAPHALLRTPAFSTEQACANCHEFLFPGPAGRAGLHMQRTVDEHTHNAEGQTCTDCHLPLEKGPRPHKNHRFPGGYDESLLKSALDVQAKRLSDKRVRVSLVPKNITHAMPTGDLFRRVVVEVFPDESAPAHGKTVYLARHFIRGSRMREVSDDRVYKTPRDLEFDVPPGALRIRVRYERVGHLRGDDEEHAEIESSVLLSEVRL